MCAVCTRLSAQIPPWVCSSDFYCPHFCHLSDGDGEAGMLRIQGLVSVNDTPDPLCECLQ